MTKYPIHPPDLVHTSTYSPQLAALSDSYKRHYHTLVEVMQLDLKASVEIVYYSNIYILLYINSFRNVSDIQ